MTRKIVILELDDGRCPFNKWFDRLKDKRAKIAVDATLARVRNGNFGDHKSVGEGVYELRIHYGGGLRVYYAIDNNTIIVILTAGNKATQRRDIALAQQLWRQYSDENN